MRRLLLSALFIWGCVAGCWGANPAGDANGDGKVNAEDAQVILKKAVSTIVLGNAEAEAADVNNDGSINALDAILALRITEQNEIWEGLQAKAAVNGLIAELDLAFTGASARISDDIEIRLLDLSGKLLDSRQIELVSAAQGKRGSASLKLPQSGAPADLANYLIEITGKWNQEAVRERISLYSITPRLSVHVFGPENFTPGRAEIIRVAVEDGASKAPLPGARVDISIEGNPGAEPVSEFTGLTDDKGLLDARLAIPKGSSGGADLIVTVVSALGQKTLKKNVGVADAVSTLLTTDKPLYQPGQTIHIRALSLRKPQMTPAVGEEIILMVSDSKGNKVFKQTSRIDDFGIAFADFTLAAELNLGSYTVSAIVGDQSSEKQVTVKRYSLPKFKITLGTDQEYYTPGAKLSGSVTANYFFGKTVAGGLVTVTASKFDVEFAPFAVVSGTLDEQGHFDFTIDLPNYFVGQPLQQGEAFVLLEIGVVDGAKHEEKISRSLPIASDAIVIHAIAESGQLIPGVENRIYLLTVYPNLAPARTACAITMGGQAVGSVETDASGIAVITMTPAGSSDIVLSVKAKDANGHTAEKAFTFTLNRASESILVRTDRSLYSVGEEAQVDIFSTGEGGSIFVDVVREGQVLYSRALDPEGGRTSLVIPLSEDLSGTLSVSAYRVTRGSDTIRDRRIIYVDPANALRLAYEPNQESYLPGQDATIRIHVKDQNEQPVVAAIGLNIVDESVFALQEMQPGMEKIYFYLEEQLRTPRYEVHGFEPEEIISQPKPDLPETWRDHAMGLLFASLPAEDLGTFSLSSYSDDQAILKKKLTDALWHDLEDLINPLERELRRFDQDQPASYFDQKISEAISHGYMTVEHASDPWGTRYRLQYAASKENFIFESAGPDKFWGTADDMAIAASYWVIANPWLRQNPQWQWDAQPVAVGGFDGRRFGGILVFANTDFEMWEDVLAGGGPPVPGQPNEGSNTNSGEKPYLRQYFPETLYSNPRILTDPNGRAEISLKMADSITSWRLTGLASSADGKLGSATAAMRVFQEFFVDLDLPPTLTRGDEVSAPVAIYNYLPVAQQVRLVVEESPWFELEDNKEKTVAIEANQVGVEYFRIRTKEVGRHKLQVTAFGSTQSDAIAREVEIVPDGSDVVTSHGGRLTGIIEKIIHIPEHAISGASKIFVKIYPGLFSQVIEGLDSMLRMPFGCFEQTSSVTYPNVLAIEYMKTTGQITPEILMKAEGFISAGYQRLLSYEVEGGGFEWFGNAPAHNVLTTYGLMEFSDMSQVWFVDPEVIRRTQKWLVDGQEQNGSWIPTEGGIAEGAINRFQNDVLRTTAYVVWGLTRSGYSGPAIDLGVAYIKTQLANPELKPETYTLALCAHALLKDPQEPLLARLFAEFEAGKKTAEEMAWWEGDAPTITYTKGQGANVELTALLAQAYMRYGAYPDTATKALNFLASAKDGNGNFGSTQATVLALKAFCMAAGGSTIPANASLRISINGMEFKTLRLAATNSDVLFLCDLQEQTRVGDNTVRLEFEGTGSSLYQIVGRHFVPWDRVLQPAEDLITIDVAYDNTELATDDIVVCNVRIANHRPETAKMIVIDVGTPPGFTVQAEDLEKLVGGKFEKYQIAGRQLIFYLKELDQKSPVAFSFRLTAQYPIRAKTPQSTVYEYYNPEVRAVAEPQEIIVTE